MYCCHRGCRLRANSWARPATIASLNCRNPSISDALPAGRSRAASSRATWLRSWRTSSRRASSLIELLTRNKTNTLIAWHPLRFQPVAAAGHHLHAVVSWPRSLRPFRWSTGVDCNRRDPQCSPSLCDRSVRGSVRLPDPRDRLGQGRWDGRRPSGCRFRRAPRPTTWFNIICGVERPPNVVLALPTGRRLAREGALGTVGGDKRRHGGINARSGVG